MRSEAVLVDEQRSGPSFRADEFADVHYDGGTRERMSWSAAMALITGSVGAPNSTDPADVLQD